MITYKRISVFALLLIFLSFLVFGCTTAPLPHDQMIPENYSISYQSKIKANIVVTDSGSHKCEYYDITRITPNEFKKALIQSAGQMISEQEGHQEFTLIVKNIDCCFGVGEFVKNTCTGKSYWALRNISSQHIVWQKHIEASGSGEYRFSPKKRKNLSKSNYAKQAIETGLTSLSKVDLVMAEKKLEELSDQWHTHRNNDSFINLYNYLLSSSNKTIQKIRDGKFQIMQGDLSSAFTRQYVNGLLGEPDNILTASKNNYVMEWVIKMDGMEKVCRLSFYQNLLSGGSIKQQE